MSVYSECIVSVMYSECIVIVSVIIVQSVNSVDRLLIVQSLKSTASV
jgi:hypothetical protein